MITIFSGKAAPTRRLLFLGALATCLAGLAATNVSAATVLSVGVRDEAGIPVAAAGFASRGALLSVTPISELTREQVVDLLTKTSIDPRAALYGVDAYRIEYNTIRAGGGPIIASGTVAMPRGIATELRTVSFSHGTIAAKDEAGSVGPDTNRLAPITFASAGYAVAAPDYLGLGTGAGYHPYLHIPSETTASVDMLRATRAFVERIGRALDRRVYVTGFSQGGPAALALGRALQEGVDRRFTLGAIAGISGLYDLFGTQFPDALDGRITPKLATISTAYYLVAMNRLYHLYGRPSRAFRAPYDISVEDLFDGYHSGGEIAARLPTTPEELLTDWAAITLRNPSGPMKRAANASDGTCLGWVPRVPVRLFASTGGDELVPFGNSQRCRQAFEAHGVHAPITEVGSVDHNSSAKRAYPLIVDFFAQDR